MVLDGEEENKSLHNIMNLSEKDVNNINNLSTQRKIKKKRIFNLFKIEDLLIIEEKLIIIVECLQYNKEINKQCFDLWNFYFNSSIINKIEKIFENEADINIVKLCINYLLISIIICYEYSFEEDIYIETNFKLLEIMELNYNNLIGFFKQIINNIDGESNNNIWVTKLINIFEHYSKNKDYFINDNDDILLTIEKIKYNNENIDIKIQNLLNYYMTENNSLLINYYLQIKTKTYEDLTLLFQKNILTIENEEGSLIASLYLRNNSIFAPLPPPYLKTKSRKKYTLVLDLDETLVNFKIKKGREGFVRLRPFLFGFLEEVSQYYELIIFTSSTEAYANSVIEAIEHDKKYFDYVFYRQHTIIVGNDFVKDLTRIGRPLNSTIIIDNMPQNFRFQKENGINIKPFWGQDSNDKALYDLIPILLDIAKGGGDVRISLNKYKDDIIGKITSSISMNK
jgi:Dullard-like phosphatase family protein